MPPEALSDAASAAPRSGAGTGPAAQPGPDDVVDGLARLLARACRRLADDGRTREASRFAADGWVLLRGAYPKQAARMDGLMHHVARQEQRFEEGARLEADERC